MKKRTIFAIILTVVGVALITAALVIMYSYPYRNNYIDWTISKYFIENSTSAGITIFKIITYLGEAIIYIAILVILYYVWDKKKAYRAIVVLVSTTVVNASAKTIFKADRPYEPYFPGHTGSETSYGIPSGHTQISTTFWGVLGSFVSKWGMLTVSIVLPLLIAFSRIYLVEHWFTDVVMGFGVAFIILAIFLVALEPIENYFENKSTTTKVLWSIGAGIVFLIPIVLLHMFPILELESMVDNFKYIAVFITASISYAVEGKLVNFDNKIEKWWKGVLRVLLAIVVLAGVYLYGEMYDPDPVTTLKMVLDVAVYALLGPVLILVLPWIMKKLKL